MRRISGRIQVVFDFTAYGGVGMHCHTRMERCHARVEALAYAHGALTCAYGGTSTTLKKVLGDKYTSQREKSWGWYTYHPTYRPTLLLGHVRYSPMPGPVFIWARYLP